MSDTPPDPALERVLGLGLSFRPTPRPVTDTALVKSLRSSSKSVKNKAFHILNPQPERIYNPKLYVPTGNQCNPYCDALDTCLDDYQSVITAAMAQPDSIHVQNTHYTEKKALETLSKQIKEGTATHIPIPADKDRQYTLVSRTQHMNIWNDLMSNPVFVQVRHSDIDWESINRQVRLIAKGALESGSITSDIHRFLVQHCKGEHRTPVANLLIKTHKLLKPCAPLPAKSRLYIDTVNYLTTPLAKYISVQLMPACEAIPYKITDTRQLMEQISNMSFPQNIIILSMDITEFYPNTTVPEGEEAMNRHLPPETAAVCTSFSKLIHETLYVQTPIGRYLLPKRYGIGLVHSGEVCDLVQSHTEQRTLQKLESCENISPLFYGRMKDDVLMILDCTDKQLDTVIEQFHTADPNKPVTVEVSRQSVDFLDVTLYKGPQFILTGKLDTKLYTKPSSSSLHLPRTSHHPDSTFDAILSNEMRRSVIASSSLTNHMSEMVKKQQQFRARGYSNGVLLNRLCLQRPIRKNSQQEFWYTRQRTLRGKTLDENKEKTKITALKIQYTSRTRTLQRHLKLSTLQDKIERNSPALSRASMGRFVIANLKTSNIRERIRYRILKQCTATGAFDQDTE